MDHALPSLLWPRLASLPWAPIPPFSPPLGSQPLAVGPALTQDDSSQDPHLNSTCKDVVSKRGRIHRPRGWHMDVCLGGCHSAHDSRRPLRPTCPTCSPAGDCSQLQPGPWKAAQRLQRRSQVGPARSPSRLGVTHIPRSTTGPPPPLPLGHQCAPLPGSNPKPQSLKFLPPSPSPACACLCSFLHGGSSPPASPPGSLFLAAEAPPSHGISASLSCTSNPPAGCFPATLHEPHSVPRPPTAGQKA